MNEWKIEDVSKMLIDQVKLFDCTYEVAWNEYMDLFAIKQFTLEEVLNYIEDMNICEIIKERDKNDNGVRYSLEDVVR